MDSVIFDLGITMLGLTVVLFVYTLPSFIAYMRHHHHFGRILAINVLTGVLILPWIGALVWASSSTSQRKNK